MSSNNKRLIYSYAYDALDRHIKSGSSDADVTQLFYCQKRLITEIKGTVSTHVFETEHVVLAQHALQGSAHTTTLIAGDDKRSTLALLNTSQPESLAYNPYGHSAELPVLHLMAGFNGERRDPLSGHYLLGNGYRAFNPALMRFNSPDSLSPFGDGGINAYAYCGGDPVNREDPTGHMPFNPLKFFKKLNPFNTPSLARKSSSQSSLLSSSTDSLANPTINPTSPDIPPTPPRRTGHADITALSTAGKAPSRISQQDVTRAYQAWEKSQLKQEKNLIEINRLLKEGTSPAATNLELQTKLTNTTRLLKAQYRLITEEFKSQAALVRRTGLH